MVNPLQKVLPTFEDATRKNVETRWLSAFGRNPVKSSASLRKCTPKKRSRQTAFSFWSIFFEKSIQRPAAMTRKSATPDRLRLLVNPFRKISPATRCDAPKKCNFRQPSAFGQSSAKSLSSVQKCSPKKRSHQTVFGFWSMPRKKPRQPSELCFEKTFRLDGFRLWVDPLQKVSPAFGNVTQPFASGCRL